MSKICLLTPAQPSINPRLVKEADALSEAGHDVQVICSHYISWADEVDTGLLETRSWACTYVGGVLNHYSAPYSWSRLRHGLAKQALSRGYKGRALLKLATARVVPELIRAAKAFRADLYIAHNLAALLPAVTAARKYGARVGFDAEDFHSGQNESPEMRALIESLEKQYLPLCDYITAGSPQIAEAYSEKYSIDCPQAILNVFPLAQRPAEFKILNSQRPLTLYWFSQTIGPQRGLEDVVKAMGLLPGCDIELHIRGNYQAGYKEALFQFARSCQVRENKIKDYAPGASDEMVRLASTYDVGLALEDTQEHNRDICLTNKLFTYLLAGNAIIATATQAQRALMERIDDAGFHYEPGDVVALAAQLKKWHDDRAALETARRQAWEYGEACFNWDVEKRKFLTIVEDSLRCDS